MSDSDLSVAEFVFDLSQLVQGVLSAAFLFGRRAGRRERVSCWRARSRSEPNTADVEIFLEAVQLEEIGQFERPDIAARMTDFLLEVTDDLDQMVPGKAATQELIPKPLPVKTEAEVLTGETAIGLVELLDLRGQRWWRAIH